MRWDYDAPDKQTIVGDGETLWLYQPDMNQVIKTPLGQAFQAATPLTLPVDRVVIAGWTGRGPQDRRLDRRGPHHRRRRDDHPHRVHEREAQRHDRGGALQVHPAPRG